MPHTRLKTLATGQNPLSQIRSVFVELFEWLGDVNLGERSHLLQPIEIERETEYRPLNDRRNNHY